MKITSENLEVYAARFYRNELCSTTLEFEEDFKLFRMVKSLSKKIHSNRGENIRLLCNHIICLGNTFEITAVKDILKFICNEELPIIKTIFLYLNFIESYEWPDTDYCLKTAKLLKEMDR